MQRNDTILIDVSRLVGRMMERGAPTGIDRVCQNYVSYYAPVASAVLYWGRYRVVYSPQSSQKIFRAITAWRKCSGLYLYGLYWSDRLRFFIPRTRGKIFLNVAHSGIEHGWYAQNLVRAGVRPVFMVHDLIPILHPEYVRAGETQRHHARLRHMLSIGAALVTNSEQTRGELLRYADEHGYVAPATKALLLGTQDLPALSLPGGVSSPDGDARPYFLILGTIEARKNHLLLLNVWKTLFRTMGADAPRLVIAGKRGWECDDVVRMLEQDSDLRHCVVELGPCDDRALVRWIGGARALLFPSLAEGYGMPMTEALSLGVPVIASDLAVFRDVAGDVPDYRPAQDIAAWREIITAYLDDTENGPRAAQLVRMASYRPATWADHFAGLDAFLASVPALSRPGLAYAYGFSWRKRRILKRFMPGMRFRFVRDLSRVPAGSDLVVWGNPQGNLSRWNVTRVEDGFIRSAGLGAALVAPFSLVIDRTGIYYDSTRPSGLEELLANGTVPQATLTRAKALIQKILDQNITKYNLGGHAWVRPNLSAGRRVLLVVGQVESDASIRCGSPHIRTNIDLLRAVRAREPDAYIVYKPHPDVVAGLRKPGPGEADAGDVADEVITDVAIHTLFPLVDAVHTMTSLSGFEALLRGVPVVCHGQPFYAGWGLTEDIFPIPGRRGRRLKLDELVAVTLLLYPTYRGRSGLAGGRAEDIIDDIANVINARREKPENPALRLYRRVLQAFLKRIAY